VSTSVGRRCRDRCVLIAVLVMMVINHACRLPCWYPLNPVKAYQCVLHQDFGIEGIACHPARGAVQLIV
jgi:hypothetical protein